jgi:hypothetical protein
MEGEVTDARKGAAAATARVQHREVEERAVLGHPVGVEDPPGEALARPAGHTKRNTERVPRPQRKSLQQAQGRPRVRRAQRQARLEDLVIVLVRDQQPNRRRSEPQRRLPRVHEGESPGHPRPPGWRGEAPEGWAPPPMESRTDPSLSEHDDREAAPGERREDGGHPW